MEWIYKMGNKPGEQLSLLKFLSRQLKTNGDAVKQMGAVKSRLGLSPLQTLPSPTVPVGTFMSRLCILVLKRG